MNVKGITASIMAVSLASVLLLATGVDFKSVVAVEPQTATITLTKIVFNNLGGTATENDFGLRVNGTIVTSGSTTTVAANKNFTINEVLVTNYFFFGIIGDAKCPTALGVNIILLPGERISCTIYNTQDIFPTDYAGLIVIKNMINDNGGNMNSSDFTITVNGTSFGNPVSYPFLGSEVGELRAIESDVLYQIREDPITGYEATITGDAKCSLNSSFTPSKLERILCVITNDDIAPTLTVIKAVTNNNGGLKTAADFTISVKNNTNNANVAGSPAIGLASPGRTYTLNAGTYTVSEAADAQYTTTFSTNCINVSLLPGDSKTCTVTNDDIVITPGGGGANFQAVINGANEVEPTNSTATGLGTFSYDDATNYLTYNISFSGLSSAETGAHIHEAPVGVDGPIRFSLPLGSPKTGTVTLSTSQETSLLAGGLYVNIHSTNFTGGEIRGQILPETVDCVVPTNVDWIIEQSCSLASSVVFTKNVIIQNGAVLTILDGVTLDINFTTKHLLIHSGGGVLIKSGGKIS